MTTFHAEIDAGGVCDCGWVYKRMYREFYSEMVRNQKGQWVYKMVSGAIVCPGCGVIIDNVRAISENELKIELFQPYYLQKECEQ